MTDTRDWADEKADAIVRTWVESIDLSEVRKTGRTDTPTHEIAAALRSARNSGWDVARRFEAELRKHIPITEASDPLCPEIMVRQAVAAAARVQPGHVREGDTDRKVLGTLPKTADGCVVGLYATLYGMNSVCIAEWHSSRWITAHEGGGHASVERSYSTRAAAEAAHTAGEGE